MKARRPYLRRFAALATGLTLGLALGAPAQASVDTADSPLFITTSIEPNLMFIIDDSGSMHFELMPDDLIRNSTRYVFPRAAGVYGSSDYSNYVPTVTDSNPYNALSRSPQVNTLYYNPGVTYAPWSKADGTLWPAATPSAAYHNPAKTSAGSRDLTTSTTQSASRWYACTAPSSCSYSTGNKTFWPATYFWHSGGNIWDWSNYTKVEIRSTTLTYTGHGRENRSDCTAGTCTYDQEIQNFANWYTYYRSRILAARAGIGKAFSQQGEGMRVGFGAINKGSTTIDGSSTHTIVRGVRTFSSDDRDDFFDMLYERDIPAAGTPLRTALDAAGQYYSRTSNQGPWGKTPGTNDSTTHLQCRQSYTILMTDGYWTEGSSYDADTSGARANVDGTNGSTISGPGGQTYQYIKSDPYQDDYSNILADVAMYYWNRDLRTDLANEVPTTPENEAFWQHMVTFGVGLGVTGSIDPDAAWDAVANGTAISWPNPVGSEPAKLDDLLHAAINGHGGFFSAANPEAFANELSEVLNAIVARVESSATAAAASSAFLHEGTKLYTAGFRSSDWSGMLSAYQVNTDGTLGSEVWNAEATLRAKAPAARNIITRTGAGAGPGVTLAMGNLSTAQQAALNTALDNTTDGLGANRINWLRGSETAHATFRSRSESGLTRPLGDIVNSNPQFAGNTDFGYSLLEDGDGGSTYITYRTTAPITTRPDMIYVGANDGMLHAFDAETGEEKFAYIPSELLLPGSGSSYARVNQLMDPNYAHRYYVDGTVAVGDAYLDGSWKTVLVGSMGAGGRTVYALDVTDPANFSTGKVMWEFTHADLGYNVGQPSIVRLNTGDWAAVFGNGYNSDNHRAVLFIVNLATGALIKAIDTGVGTAAAPNGLAAPLVSDWPAIDAMAAQTIYAGDLLGNLWRFDVSGNVSQWTQASKRSVLFQARDADNNPQPITTRPGARPIESNDALMTTYDLDDSPLMVTFGTGSFFRDQDKDSTQVQTLYGIIDYRDQATVLRSQLLQQTITWQGDVTFNGNTYTLRKVSTNTMTDSHKGWYLDLIYNNNAEGERVISSPTFPSGLSQTRVRYSTLIPDEDPCGSGRSGFIMDLDISYGGRSAYPVYDLDQDGYFEENEGEYSGIGAGAGEELVSIRTGGKERLYLGDGTVLPPVNVLGREGRESWRQLRP
jgi:type IV pilus assembly protein PilY1